MDMHISMIIFYLFLMFISRFKDQMEGARLLALIAQINSWPAAIFTELKYDIRKNPQQKSRSFFSLLFLKC